ncbi:uncharacterized protein LOC134243616 [Saccostrea cucullata]|uniref:uncharacterized protein LOC134243616 n=1 Tax=Saccostrea cuccullata TaxID=36930 RepID=UPI002ED3B715
MESTRFHSSNIVETFQEILLSKHMSVGDTDTVNVQELLYRDFCELFRHLKIDHEEIGKDYMDKLKSLAESRLRALDKRLTMFCSSTQISEEQIIDACMSDQERVDMKEFLVFANNILQGVISATPGDHSLMGIMEHLKTHRMTFDYQKEVYKVEKINKRCFGKMIIRCVGHEGTKGKEGLRRLFQACIDFLQKENTNVWENASFTIYDDDSNMYKIASGNMRYQFICRMKNGEPFIKEKTVRHSHSQDSAQQDKNCKIM